MGRRNRYGIPGRVRFKVADLLSKALGEYIDPTQVKPVTGFWKRVDVYRWEIRMTVPGRPWEAVYGCWQTMTDFVKNASKYGVEFDHKDTEIWSESPTSSEVTPQQP